MLEMAESFSPDRIEIAHVQYYGWALANRSHLMPTPSQVDASTAIIEAARERLKGRIRIDSVTPDYYASYPKACMGGWGRQTLLIDPTGRVLPCHSATVIPNLHFENVRDGSLASIWRDSEAFRRFRDESSLPDRCTTCDRRHHDFGGCRCQALLLTGDEHAVDPVCRYSEQHPTLVALRSEPPTLALAYRTSVAANPARE
jgi:pyrroloquinoline quinone biosynthesis protein E